MSRRLRVFTGGIAAEINTFSPIPTDLKSFQETYHFPAGTLPKDKPFMFSAPTWVAWQAAERENLDVLVGLYSSCQPAGRLARDTWEQLRDELLADLQRALPVDIVMLGLHGAMVADACPDCEGDILQRVRALVGPDVVVSTGLDPHCHLSKAMLDNADIMVMFKEYPHTDVLERAVELLDYSLRISRGQIKPVPAVFDCQMMAMYHTPREPMRSFVDRMSALEKQAGVVSVSLAHGFPWGDVPDMGTKVLVYTDGQPALGERLARELGTQLFALRGTTGATLLPMAEVVRQALAAERGPVVISDGSDNPGGGSPSDSTYLLHALRNARAKGVAVGLVWDPMAVSLCHAAGLGAEMDLRIGGKACALSGLPLDLHVKVTHLERNAKQDFAGTSWPLGDLAAVQGEGFSIVLNSVRSQIFSTGVFTAAGIDPTQARIIVVKSSQHFYASFAPIAAQVLYADTPGVSSFDLPALPYRHIPRPKWPFDPDHTLPVA
jgi:microcystin degradation protein MlrC